MLLASDIPSPNSYLPLVRAGHPLTAELIHTMAERGIQGLYIESPFSDDIETEDLVPPELRQEMLCIVKQEFQRLVGRNERPDAQTFGKMAESIVTSVLKRKQLMFDMIDIRDYDTYTYHHSLNVGILSVLIATQLRLKPSELQELAVAGLLHDIGKLDIPLYIVNKPGPLIKEEFLRIKEHPMRAVQHLRGVPGYTAAILDGILSHHEAFSGGGYPLGLAGDEIPLYGRIIAIADVYDALSSKRSYRDAWEPHQIIDYIISRSEVQFDPDLVPVFLQSVVAYPTGTLVQLSDGSAGLVVHNNPSHVLRPVVRVLDPVTRQQAEIDLARERFNLTIVGTLNYLPEALRPLQQDA